MEQSQFISEDLKQRMVDTEHLRREIRAMRQLCAAIVWNSNEQRIVKVPKFDIHINNLELHQTEDMRTNELVFTATRRDPNSSSPPASSSS